MERNLKEQMNESPINKLGLSSEKKKEMIYQIKQSGNPKRMIVKKPIFAPVLSAIFVVASLFIFAYYGGVELGIIDGTTADNGIRYYDVNIEKPELIAEEFTFPTKIPFKVKEVTTKTHKDYPLGTVYGVTLKGEEDQTLRISYVDLGTKRENFQIAGERVENGDFVGYYRYSQLLEDNDDIKFKRSSLDWLEHETLRYDIFYDPGESDTMLYKDELVKIAKMFE
jgi:hypothetical protein